MSAKITSGGDKFDNEPTDNRGLFPYLSPYREEPTVQLPELIRQSYADEDQEQIDKVPRERAEDVYDVDEDPLPKAVGHAREDLRDVKNQNAVSDGLSSS